MLLLLGMQDIVLQLHISHRKLDKLSYNKKFI